MSQDVAAAAAAGTVDEVWAEMNLYLSHSENLCLIFLCSDSPAALLQLRQRLEDTWVWRTAPLAYLRPEKPDGAAKWVLQSLQAQAQDRPHLRAPVWVALDQVDDEGSSAWELTRWEVMSRLNEWRSWLQAEFKRPLVFALPLVWRRRMAEAAPDLWSVRTSSAGVAATEEESRPALRHERPDVAGLCGRLAADISGADALQAADEAFDAVLDAGDVNAALALAIAMLERARRDAETGACTPRDLWVSLIKVGDAQREAGQNAAALASNRESLDLSRELRRQLGDSPGVLRDLGVSLIKVGDAQRETGQNAAALASYRESLELSRKLRHQAGDAAGVLDDLAVSLERLAALKPNPDDTPTLAERQAWITEALRLRHQLAEAFPDTPKWQGRLDIAQAIKARLDADSNPA